jgi:hypothetical protein
MKGTSNRVARSLAVAAAALACLGCAEAKLGVGPFKALSVEVGPGGVEAKGPSAGPFRTRGIEARRDEDD